MNKLFQTLVACLVGPLAVVPIFGVFMFAVVDMRNPQELLLASLMISYAIVVLIGVPFHVLVVSLRVNSLKTYLVTGFLLPVLTILAIPLLTGNTTDFWKPDTAMVLMLLGACGMGVAGLFKLVADRTPSLLDFFKQ